MKRALILTSIVLPWLPGLAADQFDGRYVGLRTIVRSAPPANPANGPASWPIVNHNIYTGFGMVTVPVAVSAAGTHERIMRTPLMVAALPPT